MENINQNKSEDKKSKLSPLGVEEINSVIKSFKESSFNKDKIYQSDEKNFVKKSLFDLAKESEKKNNVENIVTENIEDKMIPSDKKEVSETEEIEEKKNINLNEQQSINNDNKDKLDKKNEDEVSNLNKEILHDDETSKSDTLIENNFGESPANLNEDVDKNNYTISNENEFEEKTLEALDSVREAVTKSLDENVGKSVKEDEKKKIKLI